MSDDVEFHVQAFASVIAVEPARLRQCCQRGSSRLGGLLGSTEVGRGETLSRLRLFASDRFRRGQEGRGYVACNVECVPPLRFCRSAGDGSRSAAVNAARIPVPSCSPSALSKPSLDSNWGYSVPSATSAFAVTRAKRALGKPSGSNSRVAASSDRLSRYVMIKRFGERIENV